MITHSAHMYSDDFTLVGDLLMDWYPKELGYTPAVHFDFDARGNVVIEVTSNGRVPEGLWPDGVPMAIMQELKRYKKGESKLIKATMYEPDGGPAVREWYGRTPHEVMWQMTDWGYVKDPAHSMYVGVELQKAFEAIVSNKQYHQDPA